MKERDQRFLPKKSVFLKVTSNDKKELKPINGLLRDESFYGCCGIFHKPFKLKVNDEVDVNLGRLPKIEAQIIWLEDIDDQLVKVGIYLDA